jgi:hypothetical protein
VRLAATTVVRESIKGKQTTGYIYDVDWDGRVVAHKLPVPDPRFPESDDNPRGGVRGGRGVAATRHGIVVANYDTIRRYDDDWRQLDAFSHPLFVDLHEIDWDGEHLLTTSTGIDIVLQVGLDGGAEVVWDPHEGETASQLGLRARTHPVDASVDYRLQGAPRVDRCHVNCVTRHDGAMIVNCGLVLKERSTVAKLLGRARSLPMRGTGTARGGTDGHATATSAVVKVDGRGSSELLVQLTGVDFPNHNGQLLDARRLVVSDSTLNTLRIFDPLGARPPQSIEVPGTWLRGLAVLDSHRLFVGTAPAAIVLVDLDESSIIDRVQLSDDPNEAIHGLAVVPSIADRR